MKHSFSITSLLLFLFIAAQFIGLAIIYQYIDQEKSTETGKTEFKDLPIGERPAVEEETSYIPIIITLLIGTGILLLLIKFKLFGIWRFWFFLAVLIALTVAFTALVPSLVAFILALLIAVWKTWKPNIWIHNLSELFVYGGLAAIFVPLFNILSISVLLILIALYDAYAVWKSKHMITLAKSQSKAKMFAGMLIPYKLPKKRPSPNSKKLPVKTALLGGGDIGFPLIFAGVVVKEIGLWQGLLIPLFSTAALAFLFFIAKEKRFYPAMPFIGAGCFIGLGIVWLIGFLMS